MKPTTIPERCALHIRDYTSQCEIIKQRLHNFLLQSLILAVIPQATWRRPYQWQHDGQTRDCEA